MKNSNFIKTGTIRF